MQYKYGKLLSSSYDSQKLALTVKGILVGIIPLLVLVTGVSEMEINGIIDPLIDLIEKGGLIVASIMTLYGAIRKILVANGWI